MRAKLHLGSGLVLFTFVTMHLLNASLGVISIDAMEMGSVVLIAPWTNHAGLGLLIAAALTHMTLALWTTANRRTFNLPAWQWAQLGFGLSIPFLVVEHALSTAGVRLAFGMDASYAFVLAAFWRYEPILGIVQFVLLVVAWSHALIGLHHWLKLKPWYARVRSIGLVVGIILPTTALAGFVAAGLEARALSADPAWIRQVLQDVGYPGRHANVFVERGAWVMRGVVATIIALTFITCAARITVQRRTAACRVTYPSGEVVPGAAGASLLEISRQGGVPHASVCGGRGRCSTCRVRIIDGQTDLPPPSADELAVLRRMNLPHNVRLACQTRPTCGSITIEPLLPPDASVRDALQSDDRHHGDEMEIAVMFCDLRGFTTLAESRLPYDTVFLLNRYFATMGEAITESGGIVDKFIGDGIMALFGVDKDPRSGCRDAIRATRRMAEELDRMNVVFANELPEALRIGIGVQAGPAIVGEMGYGPAITLTAIGDTVNTASRLEGVTKREGVQAIIGAGVADLAGIDLSAFPRQELPMRGRQETADAYLIKDAKTLPEVPSES